jgi:hypothetical protein
MNDACGTRVDFITSNATKAEGDGRKVVGEKDVGRGYAKGNLNSNHLRSIGNIGRVRLLLQRESVGSPN